MQIVAPLLHLLDQILDHYNTNVAKNLFKRVTTHATWCIVKDYPFILCFIYMNQKCLGLSARGCPLHLIHLLITWVITNCCFNEFKKVCLLAEL